MKKLMVLILLLTGIVSCDYRVKTNDSTQNVVQSGTSYTYVIVRLEFIQQLHDICKDSLLESSYASQVLYDQAVAQCTLDSMSILNFNPSQVSSFVQQYCQPNSDLSALSAQEQANVLAACAALGY